MPNSLWPQGLKSTRLLYAWNSPGTEENSQEVQTFLPESRREAAAETRVSRHTHAITWQLEMQLQALPCPGGPIWDSDLGVQESRALRSPLHSHTSTLSRSILNSKCMLGYLQWKSVDVHFESRLLSGLRLSIYLQRCCVCRWTCTVHVSRQRNRVSRRHCVSYCDLLIRLLYMT